MHTAYIYIYDHILLIGSVQFQQSSLLSVRIPSPPAQLKAAAIEAIHLPHGCSVALRGTERSVEIVGDRWVGLKSFSCASNVCLISNDFGCRPTYVF